MKRITIEIKWALVFTVMTFAWMFAEKQAGLHDIHIDKHPIYTNLIAIPAILIYVFALLNARKKYYGGTMTYGQGIKTGLIITAIVTVLSPLSQYITSTYITPHFFENAISYAVSKKFSTLPDAKAYFNLKSYIIQGLIGAPIMGVVTTLIVAAFTKKTLKALQ
ncbi:membrane protein [Flavobacterium rivuli WB 3.3-2 = DSM 21788]|uniref:Membrane protein n=1 Tax=Flavobacterium rivuli WB 3.3-2 = DSM 21788 TaxID=1121895 RepID=A0A0A2M5U5_9FLAO|nr:DUF4199 domain-containing protein [Flavobacterium rivuli]KGO87634.1 membrane protein [Flavobacterium rivuli WB 3.3-2 = DSM 21788]